MPLFKNDIAPDFTFDSPFEKGLSLANEAKKAKYTFLIFLRYYGCRSCQVDMIDLTAEYPKFKEKDAQILVVLQSTPEIAREGSEKNNLAFNIVCDPKAELYKLYDVPSAGSKEGMTARSESASPLQQEKMLAKREKMAQWGLVHGEYEGDEYQLPAYFLLDDKLTVLKAHRASSLGDMPTAEEYLELL